ncbi:hypothetical protein C8Q78DRAFT_107389 [Trametes maxima]|nr:hypothetical protein C8Q78DRAFT_107389 [Trametes maxima]
MHSPPKIASIDSRHALPSNQPSSSTTYAGEQRSPQPHSLPFLPLRILESLTDETAACLEQPAVSDELESFTYLFIYAVLRRRKRDQELTREECALLRKMEDGERAAWVQNRKTMSHNIAAIHRAEVERPPGPTSTKGGRGLAPVAPGVARLLQVHHTQREEEEERRVLRGRRGLENAAQQSRDLESEPGSQEQKAYKRCLRAWEDVIEAAAIGRGAAVCGGKVGFRQGQGKARRLCDQAVARTPPSTTCALQSGLC